MTTSTRPPGARVGVVVVAAGRGTRLGAGVPKAFVRLRGRPLLAYAADTLARLSHQTSVVFVVPGDRVDRTHPDWAADWMEPPVTWLPDWVTLVAGGAERTDSVAAGLGALPPECDIVLVHDAARCLTPVDVFARVIAAVAAGSSAVVPGIAVVDTIKVVDDHGFVVSTPERATLRAVQTPQGFARGALDAAHATGRAATDDAALAELIGIPVRVVAGDPLAAKVTTPDDLVAAQRLLA